MTSKGSERRGGTGLRRPSSTLPLYQFEEATVANRGPMGALTAAIGENIYVVIIPGLSWVPSLIEASALSRATVTTTSQLTNGHAPSGERWMETRPVPSVALLGEYAGRDHHLAVPTIARLSIRPRWSTGVESAGVSVSHRGLRGIVLLYIRYNNKRPVEQ